MLTPSWCAPCARFGGARGPAYAQSRDDVVELKEADLDATFHLDANTLEANTLEANKRDSHDGWIVDGRH